MNNKIKNVLTKLEEEGYTAYVVGGFVRDYLLGNISYDVDIATSASSAEVKRIFDLKGEESYGTVSMKDSLYNYDITTFRVEKKYENRRPTELEFTETVEEDLLRRDFTINALYMDKDGNIHDFLGGKKDLEERTICVIGDVFEKMIEDPLRILRAIRFASSLNFSLDPKLTQFIIQNKQLLVSLSFTRKKEELNAIFAGSTPDKALSYIQEYKLEDVLEIEIPKELNVSCHPLGIWAQINYSEKYPFTKEEKEEIASIKKILHYGIIDSMVLYEYGLYLSIIAADILNISHSDVSEVYKNMPIYSAKDIVINGDDIMKLLKIEPSEKIKKILYDVELSILENRLHNDYEEIKDYILVNWREEHE